jgi:polar amino acid transport system substrate-binding protein
VVGAQVGTVYVNFLKKNGEFAEVKVYDSLAAILREVSLGHIKAGFGDAPILKYQLAENVSLRARLVPTYEPKLTGSIGIGVRKSDAELLKKINASLAKLRADGTIDKILVKWEVK